MSQFDQKPQIEIIKTPADEDNISPPSAQPKTKRPRSRPITPILLNNRHFLEDETNNNNDCNNSRSYNNNDNASFTLNGVVSAQSSANSVGRSTGAQAQESSPKTDKQTKSDFNNLSANFVPTSMVGNLSKRLIVEDTNSDKSTTRTLSGSSSSSTGSSSSALTHSSSHLSNGSSEGLLGTGGENDNDNDNNNSVKNNSHGNSCIERDSETNARVYKLSIGKNSVSPRETRGSSAKTSAKTSASSLFSDSDYDADDIQGLVHSIKRKIREHPANSSGRVMISGGSRNTLLAPRASERGTMGTRTASGTSVRSRKDAARQHRRTRSAEEADLADREQQKTGENSSGCDTSEGERDELSSHNSSSEDDYYNSRSRRRRNKEKNYGHDSSSSRRGKHNRKHKRIKLKKFFSLRFLKKLLTKIFMRYLVKGVFNIRHNKKKMLLYKRNKSNNATRIFTVVLSTTFIFFFFFMSFCRSAIGVWSGLMNGLLNKVSNSPMGILYKNVIKSTAVEPIPGLDSTTLDTEGDEMRMAANESAQSGEDGWFTDAASAGSKNRIISDSESVSATPEDANSKNTKARKAARGFLTKIRDEVRAIGRSIVEMYKTFSLPFLLFTGSMFLVCFLAVFLIVNLFVDVIVNLLFSGLVDEDDPMRRGKSQSPSKSSQIQRYLDEKNNKIAKTLTNRKKISRESSESLNSSEAWDSSEQEINDNNMDKEQNFVARDELSAKIHAAIGNVGGKSKRN